MSHGKSYNYKNPQRAWQKGSGAHCGFFTIIRKMTIPTRKADSRRSGYSPGLDSFQAIFPGTVFRFARRCQKSMITRYDTAIPLYQGLARSFGYKAKTLIKIQIVSLSAFLFGGGEGSRTPVRKAFEAVFSERSRWFQIPRRPAPSGRIWGRVASSVRPAAKLRRVRSLYF